MQTYYLYSKEINSAVKELAISVELGEQYIIEIAIEANKLKNITDILAKENITDYQVETTHQPEFIKLSLTRDYQNRLDIHTVLLAIPDTMQYAESILGYFLNRYYIYSPAPYKIKDDKSPVIIRSLHVHPNDYSLKLLFSSNVSAKIAEQFQLNIDQLPITVEQTHDKSDIDNLLAPLRAFEKTNNLSHANSDFLTAVSQNKLTEEVFKQLCQQINLDELPLKLSYVCKYFLDQNTKLPESLQDKAHQDDVKYIVGMTQDLVARWLQRNLQFLVEHVTHKQEYTLSGNTLFSIKRFDRKKDSILTIMQMSLSSYEALSNPPAYFYETEITKPTSNWSQLYQQLTWLHENNLLSINPFERFLNQWTKDGELQLKKVPKEKNHIIKLGHSITLFDSPSKHSLLVESPPAISLNVTEKTVYSTDEFPWNTTWEIYQTTPEYGETAAPLNKKHAHLQKTRMASILIPQDSRSLISHLAIGLHTNIIAEKLPVPYSHPKQYGVISLVLILKSGASLKDIPALEKYLIKNESALDQTHLRVGITRGHNDYHELTEFLKEVNELSLFDDAAAEHLKNYFHLGQREHHEEHPAFTFSDSLPEKAMVKKYAQLAAHVTESKSNVPLAWMKTIQAHYSSAGGHGGCYKFPYNREYYGFPPTKISPVFMAIVENRLDELQRLLHDDPTLVHYPDPWGSKPHEVAHSTKQYASLQIIIDAWNILTPVSHDEYRLRCLYEGFLKRNKANSPNKILDKITARYQSEVMPEDHVFHQAIRHNNLSLVKDHLRDNPELVNTPDTLGFTPLSIAVGFRHYEIAKYLLKSGAKTETYQNKTMQILVNYLDDVFDIDFIRLLLKFDVEPRSNLSPILLALVKKAFTTNELLIKEQYLDLIELFLQYNAPDEFELGVNAHDYLHHQFLTVPHDETKNDLMRIFNIFTQLADVQQGLFIPEFSALPDIAKDYIKTHNHRMLGFLNPKVQLKETKFVPTANEQFQHVLTILNDKLDAQSEIHFKLFSTAALYNKNGDLSDLGQSLFNVFFTGFKVQPAHYSEMEYFRQYFPQDKTDLTFVELGMIDNEIKTYFSFKIYCNLAEPTVRIDHVGITPGFHLMDIAYFSFRLLLAFKTQLNNAPLLATLELAYPGFAWAKILDEAKPSPKYDWGGRAHMLFQQTDFPPVDAKHNAPAVVDVTLIRRKPQSLPSHSALLMNNFFSNYLQENPSKTLCVAMNISMKAWNAYFQHIERFGFTSSDLENMGNLMGVLVNNMRPEQAQPTLPYYGHQHS